MTYWVLKSNVYIVAPSSVGPITNEERRSPEEQESQTEFMTELSNKVADFDPELINTNDAGMNE
jgi:hypothetical protein